MRVRYALIAKSVRSASDWNSTQHWGSSTSYRNLGDMEWSLCRLATTGLLFWLPCSRCRNAVGQMAGVSIKDLASEATGLGCGLGHVWVTFATGCYWVTLLGRPMLFASGAITAALMLQRPRLLAYPVPFPVCGIKRKKKLILLEICVNDQQPRGQRPPKLPLHALLCATSAITAAGSLSHYSLCGLKQ
jgi:hypothetical protein